MRGQGGPEYGYRLLARPQAGDYSLRLITGYVNVPARGTAALQVVAERHGYDGPIRLSIPDLPSDFTMAGGNIPADFDESTVKRVHNTPGWITLTAQASGREAARRLETGGLGRGRTGRTSHPPPRRGTGPDLYGQR